ncbi:hypothetical protein B0H12DRAFT_342286 [Mycena haematopus]|nr:hypothetical protein B0H12DRAFT_342286 [Mycena haematopus]
MPFCRVRYGAGGYVGRFLHRTAGFLPLAALDRHRSVPLFCSVVTSAPTSAPTPRATRHCRIFCTLAAGADGFSRVHAHAISCSNSAFAPSCCASPFFLSVSVPFLEFH